MANYTWTFDGSGSWTSTADWSPTGVPGSAAGDTATLGTQGTSYVVTEAKGTAFSLGQLNLGSTGSTSLAVNVGGALITGTLDYTTTKSGFGATQIYVAPSGIFGVTDSIVDTNNISQAITISGQGSHGAAGGVLELGNLGVGNLAALDLTFLNGQGSSANSGVIDFLSNSGPATLSEQISNFNNGDEIVVTGDTFTSATLKGGVLTVLDGTTTVLTMDHVSSSASSFKILNGDTIQAVCYARGTMVRTPEGELPVERLRPGKQVMTVVDGEEVPQIVKWLGHRRIDLRTHPKPETVAPIRILRDAVADAVPQRDLLVSPDHAVFVDGKLIAARQLVNGTTIRQETDCTAVDYYHVELDAHSIMLAEGLTAESYVDTGNSGFFANSESPLVLHPDLTDESDYPTREALSCAPFVWDEASVLPVWQSLADRAAALGKPVREADTTTEAGLHLVAKGRRVKAVYDDGALAIFALPRGVSEVHLVSRAQSPTAARPWLEDRRKLGVRIARIIVRSANEVREIPVDHPSLDAGWWAIERDGITLRRWTSGDAVLGLPAISGSAMLEIHLAEKMLYVVDAEPDVAPSDAGRRAA